MADVPAAAASTPDAGALPPDGAAPPAAAAPPPPRMAPQFSALAKKEQALQRQRAELAQHRQQIEQERAEIQRARQEHEQWKQQQDQFRRNPGALLKHYGLEYKDVTSFYLNDGQETPDLKIGAVSSEVQSLRERQDAWERKQAEEAQRQEQLRAEQADAYVAEAEQALRSEIGQFVEKYPDQYELIGFHGAEANELVFATIDEHFQRTKAAGKPVVLTIKDAADMVEAYLDEQTEKLTKTKKVQARLSPPPAADPNKPPVRPDKPTSAPTRTLTNQTTQSSAASFTSAAVNDDRMKRALAALGG